MNDLHGPHVGEEALKYVSTLLSASLRQSVVVARVGGAEFCVLCIGIEVDTARGVAERLTKLIETHAFDCDGESFQITIKSTLFSPRLENFADCLRAARREMLSTPLAP